MSTWHTVTIDGLKQAGIGVADLPAPQEEWGLHDGESWFPPLVAGEGNALVADEDSLYCNGQTKYSVEEVGAWACDFTAKHEGVTVTHDEEWDDEGMGFSSTVYTRGELDREASGTSALVPMDYVRYIGEAQAALAAHEQLHATSNKAAHSTVADNLAAQLRRLIEGIHSR